MTLQPADFVGIHQLLALYGHIVDAREWDRVNELFADDAVFDMSELGTPPVVGPDAIGRLWASQSHPIAHHTTNMVVTPAAGGWTVLTKGFGHWPDGRLGSIIYRDHVRHGRMGYRFVSRIASPRY